MGDGCACPPLESPARQCSHTDRPWPGCERRTSMAAKRTAFLIANECSHEAAEQAYKNGLPSDSVQSILHTGRFFQNAKHLKKRPIQKVWEGVWGTPLSKGAPNSSSLLQNRFGQAEHYFGAVGQAVFVRVEVGGVDHGRVRIAGTAAAQEVVDSGDAFQEIGHVFGAV